MDKIGFSIEKLQTMKKIKTIAPWTDRHRRHTIKLCTWEYYYRGSKHLWDISIQPLLWSALLFIFRLKAIRLFYLCGGTLSLTDRFALIWLLIVSRFSLLHSTGDVISQTALSIVFSFCCFHTIVRVQQCNLVAITPAKAKWSR